MPAILTANAGATATAGAHICGMFDSPAQRGALVGEFVRRGIARGDRLLFVSDEPGLRERLEAEHLACPEAFAAGRAHLASSRELYLRDGVFDPERVVRDLRAATLEAIADGYPGLRVVADMSWAAGLTAPEALGAYERLAGTVFDDGALMAVCLYDAGAFGEEVLSAVASAHPLVSGASAPDGAWAGELEDTLRLGGEIDLGNAAHLAAVLRAHAAPGRQFVLDLTALEFIDLTGLRVLTDAARGVDGGPVLVLGAPATTRRVLALLGWDRPPYFSLQETEGRPA